MKLWFWSDYDRIIHLPKGKSIILRGSVDTVVKNCFGGLIRPKVESEKVEVLTREMGWNDLVVGHALSDFANPRFIDTHRN